MSSDSLNQNLIFMILIHGVLGMSHNFIILTLNVLEPVISPFSNKSIYDHYGIVLNLQQFSWLWAGIADSFFVGGLIGSLFLAYFFETFGRRDTLMILSPCVFILSAMLQALSKVANSFEMLMLGRLLLGFAINCGNYYVYVVECVPDQVRGKASGLVALGHALWTLFGTIFVALLGKDNLWPISFVLPIVPIAVYMGFCRWLPRSPKYLYIEGKSLAEAIDSIEFYHGEDVDIDHVLKEYDDEAHIANERRTVTLRQIWKSHSLRYPFLLCILAAVAKAFSGEAIGSQYSNVIVQSLGLNQLGIIIIMAILIVFRVALGFIVSLVLIEKIGRRPLFISGVSCACVGQFVTFLAMVTYGNDDGQTSPSTWFGVIGYLLIVVGGALGIDTVAPLLMSELNPQASRSLVATTYQLISQSLDLIQILAFPPLMAKVGGYAFMPLFFVEMIALVLVIHYVPETKGLPVNEIVKHLVKDVAGDDEFDERSSLLNGVEHKIK